VATIGLPLLTEFKCFPDDQAQGLNVLDVALGITVSARPTFRAFSSGGLDQSENIVRRDPDLETEANGGFNPLSSPPGLSTPGEDPVVYMGTLDLVTRVSRSYSLWFTVPGGGSGLLFNPPLLEPTPLEQPNGSRLNLAFRGAVSVLPVEITQNASLLDGYGDQYDGAARNLPNPNVTFVGDQEWKSDISQVDGSAFYQVRLTFESNTETGVGPRLSAVGVTWQRP
jgi:hypothetical protein